MLIDEETPSALYTEQLVPMGAACWLSNLVQSEVELSDPDVLPPDAMANEVICSVLDEQNSNLTNAQKEL